MTLASNGTGLLSGGGMLALPIRWRVNRDVAEIVPARIDGMPAEIRSLNDRARLVDGGNSLELTDTTGDGRAKKLRLISHDDATKEVANWTKNLREEIEAERKAQQRAERQPQHNPVVTNAEFDDRAKLLAAIQREVKNEKGYVVLQICDADGWWRLTVKRWKQHYTLDFVEAQSGGARHLPSARQSHFLEHPPANVAPFMPVYGERMSRLVERESSRRSEEVTTSTVYAQWDEAPEFTERWLTITWMNQKSAKGPWTEMLEEMLPPNPVRLRLTSIIRR